MGAYPALAQQPSIEGKVIDQSKAVLSGAQVLLINLKTLRTWQSRADGEGTFTFQDLPEGKYEIKVAHSGFLTYSKGIKLKKPTSAKITIKMRIDPKAEVVE